MRKIIAAINMTLDGYCDHTAGIADDETHKHYSDLLKSADTLIYGRNVYKLMENYWPTLVNEPSGNESENEFAVVIDDIHKIVYSRTMTEVNWKNSTLKHEINMQEILDMKQQEGKDILVGSPSMIVAFTKLGLIDEYQINVNPVILGKGLVLFKNIEEEVELTLLKTKVFRGGGVVLYYQPK